ncbi:hypothetical protein [Chryseobacterium taihuense]|uniref:Uncharacterized protein n=1 Tax=Chryseobacterium taihuense TaxID=1141221 RepID=A0ABY0QQI6_9FLAO|nr:hypothetical protein [Chryseobacterium taihuense]SDL53178.1 hypothetical protein SAMN05216273_10269 [Chryseobacterium taihuense]
MAKNEELNFDFDPDNIPDTNTFWNGLDAYWHANRQFPQGTDQKLSKKADLIDGKIPSSQLPSYVDDVLEFNSFGDLPNPGEQGKIYVTTDKNSILRWNGTEYIQLNSEIDGEIVVQSVPNSMGTVLTYNPTTKKVSTRTNTEIISDMSLMTTNTVQHTTNRKFFDTYGTDWGDNSLLVYAIAPLNPAMTFYKEGESIGQIQYNLFNFNFINHDGSGYNSITASAFKKAGGNGNNLLKDDGSTIAISSLATTHYHDYLQSDSLYLNTDLNNEGEPRKYKFRPAVMDNSPNMFPAMHNANGIISISTWENVYEHQLGFSSNGNIYHRHKDTSGFHNWGKVLTSTNSNLVTLDTEQDISSRKNFNGATGNNYGQNAIEVRGNGVSDTIYAGIGFHQPGLYAASLLYKGPTFGFEFVNVTNTAYEKIKANGFIKAGYNDGFILLAGGGHVPISEFVINSDLTNQLTNYHKRDSTGALYNESDTHTNQTWFDYNWAGTGELGSVINYSGLGDQYSTEVFGSYNNPDKVAIRTRQGDINAWNEPRWLWHDKNFNPATKADVSQLVNYLPLSGGTLSGELVINRPNGTSFSNISPHLRLSASNLDSTSFLFFIPQSNVGQIAIGNAFAWGTIELQPFGGDATLRGENIATQNWVTNNHWDKYDLGFRGINDNDIRNFSFLTSNGNIAKKINVGGLLVSDKYQDEGRIPTNGSYIKGLIDTSNGISKTYYNGYGAVNIRNNVTECSEWGTNIVGAIVIQFPDLTTYQEFLEISIVDVQYVNMFQKLNVQIYGNAISLCKASYINDTDSGDYVNLVRVGINPSGNRCLIINDINTVWQYPQIIVDKFIGGGRDTAIGNWTTELVTDLSAYTIQTNVPITKAVNASNLTAQLQNYYTKNEALNLFVGKNGIETIFDTKTFSSSPIVPNATLGNHAVNLNQADGRYVNMLYDQNIGGIKNFTGAYTQWVLNGDSNNAIAFVQSLPDRVALGSINNKDIGIYRNLALKLNFKENEAEFTDNVKIPNGILASHAVNLSQLNSAIGSHTHTFASLTSKPTTLLGYGITDAIPTSHPVNGVNATQINSWNSAFSWGNHAVAGYATSDFVDESIAQITAEFINPDYPISTSCKVNTVIITEEFIQEYVTLEDELLPERQITITNLSPHNIGVIREDKKIDTISPGETTEYYVTSEKRLVKKGTYKGAVFLN